MMKKEKTPGTRHLYHKKKHLKKLFLIGISFFLLLLSLSWFKNKQGAIPKIDEIGGPKVELTSPNNKGAAQPPQQTTTSSTLTSAKNIAITSDDPNVKRAYHNPSWHVIPTQQTGPHTINFEEDSADRKEIDQAVLNVTTLPADDLIVWWLTGSGDDRIIAIVSNQTKDKLFRVHLLWVNQQGWLAEQVDELNSLPTFK